MTSKRRGVLAGLAGIAVVLVKGLDEGAVLLARSADEFLVAIRKWGDDAAKGGDDAAKGGDDAAKGGDDAAESSDDVKQDNGDSIVEKGQRYVRRKRIESLLERERANESFTLPPGWYGGFEITTPDRPDLTYEFETRGDHIVDVLLFDESSFIEYDAAESVDWRVAGTTLASSGRRATTELEPGRTYYLVVDNTTAGLAGRIETDVTVDVSVRLDNA